MTFFYLLIGAAVFIFILRAASKRNAAATSESHRALDYDVGGTRDQDKDEWEGSFWEVLQPISIRARFRIAYVDGAGRRTERSIEVRQFGEYGSTNLLVAHCLLRNATRIFRVDRILSCIDEETGEVISEPVSHLRRKYEQSPEYSPDTLLEEEFDSLRILLYVGKADGQLRAAEKRIIRETFVSMTADSRITDELIEELFVGMQVPTLNSFRLAVGRLAKREPSVRKMLIEAAERMVATQKTVHPSEQDALDYMRKRCA